MNIMSFLSPIKKIKNLSLNKVTNPITFSGKNDELPQDTFEYQDEISKEIERVTKKLSLKLNYEEKKKYTLYLEVLKEHPTFAFIYNPDLTGKEKDELGEEKGVLSTVKLSEKIGIPIIIIGMWCDNGLFGDIHTSIRLDNKKYIDTKTEQAKSFLETLEKNKDNYVLLSDYYTQFGISEDRLRKYLKEGRFKLVGLDEYNLPSRTGFASVLIDLRDEKTIQTLNEIKKLYPKKSEYFEKEEVPASYLVKLGFGDIQTIRDMIKQGVLEGTIAKSKDGKKARTTVKKNSSKNEINLQALRHNCKKVKDAKTLAKELKIKESAIKEALLNDELEIIPEYLYASDWNKVFIDITNPKNDEFISKVILEKQIEKELKLQERAEKKLERIEKLSEYSKFQSLKMTLVWNFCKRTRQIASQLASRDGYVCKLLIKEDEGKKLTTGEEIKINSYRKTVWNTAGTDEFKEAYKKAMIILEEYQNGGIEAVSDSEARKIIEQYLFSV